MPDRKKERSGRGERRLNETLKPTGPQHPVFHHVFWVNVQGWKGNRVVEICEASLIT